MCHNSQVGMALQHFKNSTYPQIMSKVQKITLTTCLKAPLETQMESVRSCGGEGNSYGTPFTLKNITGQYQAIIKGQALY